MSRQQTPTQTPTETAPETAPETPTQLTEQQYLIRFYLDPVLNPYLLDDETKEEMSNYIKKNNKIHSLAMDGSEEAINTLKKIVNRGYGNVDDFGVGVLNIEGVGEIDVTTITPLALAVSLGKKDVAYFLIEQGAEPTKKNNAVAHEKLPPELGRMTKEEREEFKAEIRKRRNEYKLRKAIKENNLDKVKEYVEPGRFSRSKLTNINAVDSEGKSMLDYATNNEIIEYLKAHGAAVPPGVQEAKQTINEIIALDERLVSYFKRYSEQEVLPNTKAMADKYILEIEESIKHLKSESEKGSGYFESVLNNDPNFYTKMKNETENLDNILSPMRPSFMDNLVTAEINLKLTNAIHDDNITKFNEVLEYKARLYGKESTFGISYAYAKDTHSLLALAIENGKEDMAKALIENGARINARLINTATDGSRIAKPMLALAIEKGNVEIVNALLKNGADFHAPASDNIDSLESSKEKPMLALAIEKGNVEIVNALLERGVDINALYTQKNELEGYTEQKPMLALAIEKGNVEIVNALLERGVDSNELHTYIWLNSDITDIPTNEGRAKALLERGVDSNTVSTLISLGGGSLGTMSVLKKAIEKDNVEIVNALLTKNPKMYSFILEAASDKSPEIKNAIKTYIANNNGQGELFEEAVSYRDEKTVKFLFDNFSTSEFSISDSERIYGVVDKLEALKTNSTFSTEEQKTLGKLSRKAFTEVGSYTHFSSPGQASNVKQALDEVNRLGDNNLKNELRGILLNPELDYNESLVHASIAALRAGNEQIGNIINKKINRTVDQALDNELKGHSPEYIALKFKGQRVDFNKLITQCSAESANIIVQAAEKQKGMENSPPSKWKELLIEFSDFCRNIGKKVGVERMRESLTNPRTTTSFPPAIQRKAGQRIGI